jgi:hypothetical protein
MGEEDMIGQTDLALRFVRKARNLDPDDTATQRAVLDGYMRIGHRKFAKQLLESARRGAADLDYHPALEVHEYLDGERRDRKHACRQSSSNDLGDERNYSA